MVKTKRSGSTTSTNSPSQWISGPGPLITKLYLAPGRTSQSIDSRTTAKPSPPYQSAKRSASVHSRQTSSRGASKTRVMSMPFASATAFGEAHGHPVEAPLPEALVVADPAGRLAQRGITQASWAQLAVRPAGDEAGVLQHPEVLGDRLDRDREGRGELGQGRLALGEALQ